MHTYPSMTDVEFIENFGLTLYADFKAFMHGNTVKANSKGEVEYYGHDISNFFALNSERFFD